MRYAVTAFPTHYPRSIREVSLCAVAVAALLIVITGCGMKADIVPPGVVLPQAASQLRVQRTDPGVTLFWTMPAGATDVTGFRILRSEIETTGADCPGCPREYLLLADLSPGARELKREGGGKYGYGDYTVRPGRLYSYRVIVCYESGMCGETPESVEIKYD